MKTKMIALREIFINDQWEISGYYKFIEPILLQILIDWSAQIKHNPHEAMQWFSGVIYWESSLSKQAQYFSAGNEMWTFFIPTNEELLLLDFEDKIFQSGEYKQGE